LYICIVPALTKCALLTSFKHTIGETAAYRYLQSDFANKLSGAGGLQVFDDRPEGNGLVVEDVSSVTAA
jgi:hypothetical protein